MTLQDVNACDVKVTILNRLSAQDNSTKKDIWKKTQIDTAQWSIVTKSAQEGIQTATDKTIKVCIPKQGNYLPYIQWKDRPTGKITFSQGDYIIKGEVKEDVSAENITAMVKKYGQDVCKIKSFKDNSISGLSFSPVGFLKYAECYTIEGE